MLLVCVLMCMHMYVHVCKDQKLIPSIFLRLF